MKLILVDPEDRTNFNKIILDTSKWRMIKEIDGVFYIVSSSLSGYKVFDFSIEKFHSMCKAGLDLTLNGGFYSVFLACHKCRGTGITDWITKITGTNHLSLNYDKINFEPGEIIESEYETTKIYFRQAKVPESYERCSECNGTGLYAYTRYSKVLKYLV